MYSFDPTDEQKMLIEAAGRYARNDLRPAAHAASESGALPARLLERGWELGLLQASLPEVYGGFGERSVVTGVLALEELAWGDLAGAMANMLPSAFALPILLAGTDKQKRYWLQPLAEGAWAPVGVALAEPRYDFHPLSLETVASRDGTGYTLEGVKTYVPYAEEAEAILVYASFEGYPEAFIVPSGTGGVRVEAREKLAGVRALPVSRLCLEGASVPADARLGGERRLEFEPILAAYRVASAAMAVGLSRAAYEYALSYAQEREAFGTPIAHKQSIAFMLAEMATELEAIRLLVWEASWLLDGGGDASKAAYLAHSGAADLAMMVTDRAVQILGGHGYIREHPVERWMRDARGIPNFVGLGMV